MSSICYVDYQKEFDSVWRVGLWHIMRYLGYEEKMLDYLRHSIRVRSVL